MSEDVKTYIIISASLLLIIFSLAVCYLFKNIFLFSWIFAYLIGIGNGMIIIGVNNNE